MRCKSRFSVLLLASFLCGVSFATGADWPTWRGDAGRTANTDEQLPDELHLQWSRQLPPLTPAWPEDIRLQFDANYEPVVVFEQMYVSSPRDDSVTALDTSTGKQVWQFFAEGPVRLSPVVHEGRIYFGADDGCLYCLSADKGSLIWKFNAAPSDRRVIGNERLISVWPVRGGPVLVDDTIYFTVGVWPFEGTILYSLDISQKGNQPPEHTSQMLKDFAPQGFIAANGNRLFIPGGRSNALCIDRTTGKTIGVKYSAKGLTDYHVTSADRWMFHGGKVVDVETNRTFPIEAVRPVVADGRIYYAHKGKAEAKDLANLTIVKKKDRRGKLIDIEVPTHLWRLEGQPITKVHIKAGNRLYAHHGSTVLAINVPQDDAKPEVSWKAEVTGTPSTMLAANGRLYVVTKQGMIHCFGTAKVEPHSIAVDETPLAALDDAWAEQAAEILNQADTEDGYCLALGIGSGKLIHELLRQSDLRIIAIDPDAKKVDSLRRSFATNGIYGKRLAAHVADPLSFALPPYLASLIVSEDLEAAGAADASRFAQHIFRALRPYGGCACFKLDAGMRLDGSALPNAMMKLTGDLTLLKRDGALPDSADWTHEYGDPANTLMSRDKLVKAPLGVLWFGGPAGDGNLFYDRHKWGPSMAVIEGRMFLQGPAKFTAVDVYTGRILWQKKLPQGASPGRRANWPGSPGYHFVAMKDAIYLAYPKQCLRLDPRTGEEVASFSLPDEEDLWGRIRIQNVIMIVPVFRGADPKSRLPKKLVALDRHTGKVIWENETEQSFPMVAIGTDKVFCVEGLIEALYTGADKRRKGGNPTSEIAPTVKAFDISDGKEVWASTTPRVPSWLAYSPEHDVLLTTNKNGLDARRGIDGEDLWKNESTGKGFQGHPENYYGRVIMWKDQVLDQRGPGKAYDVRTGEPIMRRHPLTDELIPWEFTKIGHHCNYAIASEHLMTFRAADAGFCDLATGGTSRLTGFRSACRNSLIPANGVLNAPNMAHGCKCSYSIFTSLALVHVPESDLWTYGAYKPAKEAITRLGVNFGAGGDRVDVNGTTWLDYPAKGEPSPQASVSLKADPQKIFRLHSAQVSGDGPSWVGASGVEGVRSVSIALGKTEERSYTVRLFFAEPLENAAEKSRVFDVDIQGVVGLEDFDVSEAAGGNRRVVVKEFDGIRSDGRLTINFIPKHGLPLICGIEVVAE